MIQGGTKGLDIKKYLREKKDLIDSFIDSCFRDVRPERLRSSVLYSLTAGGKRIRPVLCIAAYEACGGDGDIVPCAAALEFIHTYSLIHDDLPAMDDDDLRRGKPTNHKVFGEAMAILAGDALLTEAFALIARHVAADPLIPASSGLWVIHDLATAAGIRGMVAGQAQDILSEGEEPDAETLAFIHTHKTAALITASVRIGGMLAGCSDDILESLTRYGRATGLAFQITDDILDVVGDTGVLGKTTGSDEEKNKLTYPRLFGIAAARQKALQLVDEAVDALSSFDGKADPLREIARFLSTRVS